MPKDHHINPSSWDMFCSALCAPRSRHSDTESETLLLAAGWIPHASDRRVHAAGWLRSTPTDVPEGYRATQEQVQLSLKVRSAVPALSHAAIHEVPDDLGAPSLADSHSREGSALQESRAELFGFSLRPLFVPKQQQRLELERVLAEERSRTAEQARTTTLAP